MSMTREEAIKAFEEIRENAQNNLGAKWAHGCDGYYRDKIELADVALSTLRPVSREQVEKSWRGEWRLFDDCANEGLYCSQCGKKVYRVEYANVKMATRFCPNCMSAVTDEAVEKVMERLEKLKNEIG